MSSRATSGARARLPDRERPVASSRTAVPADGVYAGWLRRLDQPDGTVLPAAISVGTNPTFDGTDRRVEAYVLDRDDLELYGVIVEIAFTERLRGMCNSTRSTPCSNRWPKTSTGRATCSPRRPTCRAADRRLPGAQDGRNSLPVRRAGVSRASSADWSHLLSIGVMTDATFDASGWRPGALAWEAPQPSPRRVLHGVRLLAGG